MKKMFQMPLLLAFIALCAACGKKDTPAPPPSIPQMVQASENFAIKIEVKWSPSANAEGYYVYRSDYNADTTKLEFKPVGTVKDSTSYVDIGVISASSYYYKVEAFRGADKSGQSEKALGKTKVITADEAYTLLAELTGGIRYDATRASEVPGIIIKVINENATTGTDLVFLIDNTGSMSDDIYEVRRALNDIISKLPARTMLGAATYNDANEVPSTWYTWENLTATYSNISTYINNIRVYGGGDYAESVYDGLYQTLDKMSWSSTRKRMIIIIGDAPPLEGKLTTYSLKDVADKCKALGVAANLYPILIK